MSNGRYPGHVEVKLVPSVTKDRVQGTNKRSVATKVHAKDKRQNINPTLTK